MSGTLTVFGALGGALVVAGAGTIGARAVLAAAVNDEQRHEARQILTCGSLYAAAVMGVVLLAAFQVVAGWAYAVALVLWFGPLLPALTWAQRRLDAIADGAAGPFPVTAA